MIYTLHARRYNLGIDSRETMHLHEDKHEIQNKRDFPVVKSNSTLIFPLIANTVRVKPIQTAKILNTYGGQYGSITTADIPHDESIDFKASSHIGISETKTVAKTAVDDTNSKTLGKSDNDYLNFL